jgi:hypothetical protein
MTGNDGTVTFQLRAKAGGEYRSTVTDVSRSGWTYTAGANEMSEAELDVPYKREGDAERAGSGDSALFLCW